MIFKKKVDGVIEGVKYNQDGTIDWVRVYQRRDMAYTDVIILQRGELIDELARGKQYKTGKRVEYLGNSFETDREVNLVELEGSTYIQTEDNDHAGDHLEGVPIF